MDIKSLNNIAIDWESLPTQKTNGISGYVLSRAVECAPFTLRQLSFSEGYEADHWCEKGHIIYVLKGELIIQYKDNSSELIPQNNSLILGDNISWHKAKTQKETTILIID